MEFKDHFSTKTDDYARFRPGYPDELFAYFASLTREHLKAWDCATGSGQAAAGLADHYQTVVATDASQVQLDNAYQAKGVTYQQATAEESGLPAQSCDLITVAQALHWFDLTGFTCEVKRVLKPGGVLAVWSYNLISISAEIDKVIADFYHNVIGPFWPAERKMVENGYADVSMPMKSLELPPFNLTEQWSLSQVLGYIRTWSAIKGYQKEHNIDPVVELESQLVALWPISDEKRSVCWPLTVKVWRN